MIDKFSQVLTLMREAFEDAQTGATYLPPLDLAAEVDRAQRVINAASAVQTLRVAQYACQDVEQDACGVWVDTNRGQSSPDLRGQGGERQAASSRVASPDHAW